MRLTHVIASVNDNPDYYLFIPKQISFWKKFNIRFLAIFIVNANANANEVENINTGEPILPMELQPYKDNILVWVNHHKHINTSFIGQNIRIYYPSLLSGLADDEMVMITDMDMLPMNAAYYTEGLTHFQKDDFIYYRHIDGNQIYMCYNAAHPDTWSKAFGINSVADIDARIKETYDQTYNAIPGSCGWYTDQLILYKYLINYPSLKVLERPLRRLETWNFKRLLTDQRWTEQGICFVGDFDDCHFHRSFGNNRDLIEIAEKQLDINKI